MQQPATPASLKRSKRKYVGPTDDYSLLLAEALCIDIADNINPRAVRAGYTLETPYPCKTSNHQVKYHIEGTFVECDTKSANEKFTPMAEVRLMRHEGMWQLFRGRGLILFRAVKDPFTITSMMLSYLNSRIGAIQCTAHESHNHVGYTSLYSPVSRSMSTKFIEQGYACKTKKFHSTIFYADEQENKVGQKRKHALKAQSAGAPPAAAGKPLKKKKRATLFNTGMFTVYADTKSIFMYRQTKRMYKIIKTVCGNDIHTQNKPTSTKRLNYRRSRAVSFARAVFRGLELFHKNERAVKAKK
jgi:hypothetical protein